MGMFDDLIPQGGSQQAPAPESAPTPAMEDPLTVGLVNVANIGSMGTLPAMAGGVNYALEAGASGAYDRGQQRVADFLKYGDIHHPDASTGGRLGGAALLAAWPAARAGQILAKAPGALWQVLRMGLRRLPGGKAADFVMEHAGNIAKEYRAATKPAEQAAAQAPAAETAGIGPNLASALRTGKFRTEGAPRSRTPSRSAGFQGTGDPFSGPAPNAGIRSLSPEMQAKADAYQAFLRRHAMNAEEPIGPTGSANWPSGLADALRRMRQ